MNKTRNIPVTIAIYILSLFLVMAFASSVISPYNPYEMGIPFQPPSSAHWLGTNDIGQDILSELIYGSRISLLIGVVSAIIVSVVSVVLGILSGYYGGRIDAVITWITNTAMLIPSLALTIILVAYLKAGIFNIIVAICITAWPSTTRMIRAKVMQIAQMPFIKAEEAMGVGKIRIMLFHILPNVADIVFVRGVMSISSAMLTEAGLSFMGLGIITQKTWGGILHYAFYRNGVLNGYWWWYLPPIICICLSSLGFLLLGYRQREPQRCQII